MEELELNQGTRQGYPLSPLLFVIMIETLAIVIRREIEVCGIQIGQDNFKLSRSVDNLALSIMKPFESLPFTLRILHSFFVRGNGIIQDMELICRNQAGCILVWMYLRRMNLLI